MHLTFRQHGGVRNKEVLRSAATFYLDKLLTKKQIKDLEIEVIIKNKRLYGRGDDGEIVLNDLPHGRYHPHKKFTIYIKRSLDLKDKLQTLAHEMIHLSQFATGKMMEKMLIGKAHNNVMWKGRWYGKFDKQEYMERPWEKEAWEGEESLCNKFLNTILENPLKLLSKFKKQLKKIL